MPDMCAGAASHPPGLAAATAGDDLDAGLRAYDEVRRPRTQRLARISGSSARVQQANHRVTAGLRDLMVRLLPKRAYLNAGADALAWTPPGPEVRAPAVTTLDVQYSPSALVPDLSVTLAEYHARSA